MYVSLDRGGRILPNLPDIFADSEGFGIPPSVKTLVLSLNQEDKFPDLPAFAELSTLSINIIETYHPTEPIPFQPFTYSHLTTLNINENQCDCHWPIDY